MHVGKTHMCQSYDDPKHHNNPTSDHALLHDVNPCLVEAKELILKQVKRFANEVVLDDAPARRTFASHERHNKVSAENIAEMWGIGIKRACATLSCFKNSFPIIEIFSKIFSFSHNFFFSFFLVTPQYHVQPFIFTSIFYIISCFCMNILKFFLSVC